MSINTRKAKIEMHIIGIITAYLRLADRPHGKIAEFSGRKSGISPESAPAAIWISAQKIHGVLMLSKLFT
jgi:hypothetical protein